MNFTVRTIILFAMILLTMVSIWTTYVSLNDSILPEPKLDIPVMEGMIWHCSVVAFALALAIGLMLFALKAAVINGQKRLNLFGILGMTVVAFISIAFNMDVLYRTADKQFFLRYSTDRMRSVYEDYLSQVQAKLTEQKTELKRGVAKQEGELDSEIRGLRKAPEGYGQYARQEDYKLTVLQKTTEVDLASIEEGLQKKEAADAVLRENIPATLDDIETLQQKLRVECKDLAGISGIPLPAVVIQESPFFAVFQKLFDYRTVGLKEIFFMLIAFFLDLGDIIGYSLIPGRKQVKEKAKVDRLPANLALLGPERIPNPPLLEGPVSAALTEEALKPVMLARSRRRHNFTLRG